MKPYLNILVLFCTTTLLAQPNLAAIKGTVTNLAGEALIGITVLVGNTSTGTASDFEGNFLIESIPQGNYTLSISGIGYETQHILVQINPNQVQTLNITLKENLDQLNEVVVQGKNISTQRKEDAYAIEVIDAKNLQAMNVNLNQISNQLAGIRVRESGGLGSKFSYSLNGMSGRSIRFFMDGVPMDRLGSAFSINNIPINLLDRVEFYKGVVPPHFGSDALGGVVNLVSKKTYKSYLDASISYGSFNTQIAAISTRWVSPNKKWYIDAKGFYNYSDNDYSVWGDGVEVADPITGRTVPIKTTRFHDAYQSYSAVAEVGVQNQKWADLFRTNFLFAENNNEIQHGTTMPDVYGEARRTEASQSGSAQYKKNDIINGVHINVFSSLSKLRTYTIDTCSRTYNWLGEIVDEQPTSSELGSGSNGKSLLTLHSNNMFSQANVSYDVNNKQTINANYTIDYTTRYGDDPLKSDRTVSFIEDQKLSKQIASLAYVSKFWDDKMENTIWFKHYHFSASTVDEKYVEDSTGYSPKAFPIEVNYGKIGYGLASKFILHTKHIIKVSFEKTVRIPDTEEILGDGLFVGQSPYLKPEESYNFNLGILSSQLPIYTHGYLSVEPSFFYRNVSNLIQYVLLENRGNGQFQNIDKVLGIGGSLDINYTYKNWLKLRANTTYQAMRDGKEYVGRDRNITYKALIPNTPYFMANGGITLNRQNWFQKNNRVSFYWDIQYVHEFYLKWPSLGSSNKSTIPSQLVNNAGISYAIKSDKLSISFNANNIFNELVYDNYLLQKPGRSFSIKIRTYITKL